MADDVENGEAEAALPYAVLPVHDGLVNDPVDRKMPVELVLTRREVESQRVLEPLEILDLELL